LLAMVGKAERGPAAIDVIRRYRSAYLIAIGGAALLVSNAIRASRIVAFPELGMEAIYEFEVEDMPVTVAVSADGENVHEIGPKAWMGRFAGIPVNVE
jgi:fumarate hydratase class I